MSEEEEKEKKKFLTVKEMLAQETTNLLSIKNFRTNIEDDDDREMIDGKD